MQVMSPSPRPHSPTRSPNNGLTHVHSPRRISFEVSRVPRNSSAARPRSSATLAAAANVLPMPGSRLGVVDLTDSPIPSPSPSSAPLSPSPTSISSSMTLAVPPSKSSRPKSLARLSQVPPGSQSASSILPSPPSANVPQESSPRRRPKFILPSDGDDRDHGDGLEDSDDSDRTSFFSAEEFVVPESVLHNAVGAPGRVLDSQVAQRSNRRSYGWHTLELELGTMLDAPEHYVAQLVGDEQDTAHAVRRWHALTEIVNTEAGYVRDLRVLKLYLVLLPSLPLSIPAFQAAQELLQEVTELLLLHEGFLLSLVNASLLAADGASPVGSIDEAIRQVAALFIKEASKFDLYQRFCATQPDTLRLLRPVQSRAEWTAFEQRCAAGADEGTELDYLVQSREGKTAIESSDTVNSGAVVTPNSAPASTTATTVAPRLQTRRAPPPRTLSLMPSAFRAYASPSSASHSPDLPLSIRRHSYDSLAAVFGASGLGSVKHKPGNVTPTYESSSSSSSTCPSTPSSRLRFHDYLIKPVQRICKYPLMLEGLRSKTHGEITDATVASAVESMRAVATRVDEARRQKEAATRSKLIIDRIEPHAVVTTDFIKSLGECLLAGSLDVVHHHHILHPVTTPVRVRYMGAFLYLGGYLLLVKVDKGKMYRIKHWFSLAPFELVDIPQDTALVPCSFRLSYMDHHFEIAAACQREKDLWMRAINEARCARPAWICEPVSSLQIVQVDSTMPPVDGNALEVVESPAGLTGVASSSNISDQSNPLAILRLSTPRSRMSTSHPTVRIFSLSDGSSILLRRSSGTNRIFVDRGLVDVLSELVSTLRKQAQAREEILFPPPLSSDTSQTISIAAKNRLTRRGSMLVARPRTLVISGAADSEEDAAGQSSSTVRRNNTSSSRSRMSPATSVLCTEPERLDDPSTGDSRPKLEVPTPRASFSKSHSPSGTVSLPTSPTIPSIQQASSSSGVTDSPHNHRRARSLVCSVKDLMRRATTKRTAALQASEAWQALQTPDDASSDAGESTETTSSSGRRRVSSAPTSPPLTSPTCGSFSKSCSHHQPTIIDNSIPQSDPQSPPSSTSSLKPPDKKTDSTTPANSEPALNPRRSFKSFIFYNRLAAIDPA